MRATFLVIALPIAAWLLADSRPTRAQEAAPDLHARLAELERRVERLERLAGVEPAGAGVSVAQAQARLAAAEQQLRHAERLHRKGYITTLELQADRLAALAARKQLELARDGLGNAGTLLELDVLEAEYQLSLSRELLERDRRLAAKGFITAAQLRANELAVERDRALLERARAKFAAADEPPEDER